MGFAIDIGRWILNDNFGLFLYTLLQTAVYSSVLAYSIKFARNNGIGTKWCMLLLAIYIFVPMFPFYTVAAVKDTYYTAFMILYVLFIFDIVKNYREKPISIKYMLYKRNIPYKLQMAQQAKGFVTDAKLKEWGMWDIGHKHARDACRHCVYYLVSQKPKKI